jgi:hypothetical protein
MIAEIRCRSLSAANGVRRDDEIIVSQFTPAPYRDEAGGGGEVEVGEEEAFFAVGLPGLESAVRADDGGGSGGAGTGVVDGGEVASVLGGPAEGRLLVKGVGPIGEGGRPVGAGLRLEGPVKHHSRSPPGGPADRLRVPKPIVADRDSKFQGAA